MTTVVDVVRKAVQPPVAGRLAARTVVLPKGTVMTAAWTPDKRHHFSDSGCRTGSVRRYCASRVRNVSPIGSRG